MAAFFAGQCLITFALYLVCNMLTILSIPLTGSYGYAISGPITFALYAFVWAAIWYVSYQKNGMQNFWLKLISATLPLIALTVAYIALHPAPNYRMMIPILPEDIHFDFASAITGTLLFPWYAIALQRLFAGTHRATQFFALMIPGAIAGALCFTGCYMALPANW